MQLPIQILVSLKTAIGEEWNKMSEEFILKICKLFRRRVDMIFEKKKWRPYWVNLLFCINLFILFIFKKFELILFYNRIVYHYIYPVNTARPLAQVMTINKGQT